MVATRHPYATAADPSLMPESLLLTDRPARAASAESESTADDCFVLDLDSGRYYSLGEVGGFIWDRLDGELDLDAIAGQVASSFQVDRRQAGEDLLEFVAGLHELGLLAGSARR